LPTTAHYLTMAWVLPAGDPDPLQHRRGREIRQFPAVTPVGLDPNDSVPKIFLTGELEVLIGLHK